MNLPQNTITRIEAALKQAVETRVLLDGLPVPVQVVTPDPDFVELEAPCLTLELQDIRRDPVRAGDDRCVEVDEASMEATVRPATVPYNLHFAVGIHTADTRTGRLLLESVLLFLAAQPALDLPDGREAYLSPDMSFRNLTRMRDLHQTVGIVVKARLEPSTVRVVPVARDHSVGIEEV